MIDSAKPVWEGRGTLVAMGRILTIEDDEAVRELIRVLLEMRGHQVSAAADGGEGLRLAQEWQPELILLDINLPDIDGFEVGKRLRQSARLSMVPIVMLTAKATTADKLTGFAMGADDYITKPFEADELLARVEAHLRRLEQGLLSELTGLPGNTLIERAIKRTVEMVGRRWAVLYVDMDQFKAYNDVYGFLAGNELIRALARILRDAVASAAGDPDLDFVGHIGGDDFVAITAAERAVEVCREVIRRFDAEVPGHYSPQDRARGFVVTPDRQGHAQEFPLVTVSIAVVTNRRSIHNYLEVATIAAEVKKKAKAIKGSSYYVDQRQAKAAMDR